MDLVMANILYLLFVFGFVALVKSTTSEINSKTIVHVYGEEHFLKECSFDSATVKAVYPTLKAPIYQVLQNPLFVLVKTSDKANAVFLPEGLSKPVTNPPVNPPIDVMLRSYEERYSLIFSLAHFPFKHFKEITLNDFLMNAKNLKTVPLTDIPVMAFYTKTELDELKTFFKFFYMGDLEISSNTVTPNRKSSDAYTGFPKSGEPPAGYPYTNRLPANHPQKHAFYLAPVPVIVPKQTPVPGVHNDNDNNNHNILNRSLAVAEQMKSNEHSMSPEVSKSREQPFVHNVPNKSAVDFPVYSYRGVPLYIPKSMSHPTDEPMAYSLPSGISSTESIESYSPTELSSSNAPQPYSLPAGVSGGEEETHHVSLVFPSTPQPYSLPSGFGGIEH